jgi:D-glycero-D-manno-heptose 1,7-bisphosphate phosphatase
MRRVVFLDRDGTINVEVPGFLTAPEQLELLPGAGDAIAALNTAGCAVVVVTNQSAIARGLLSEAGLESIHEKLHRLLAAHSARIDAIYTCPHHPEAPLPAYRVACDCRKPRPGLVLRAARELALDLATAHLVGDATRDVEVALTTPVTPWLVRTGKGADSEVEARERIGPRLNVVADLAAAVAAITSRSTPPSGAPLPPG